MNSHGSLQGENAHAPKDGGGGRRRKVAARRSGAESGRKSGVSSKKGPRDPVKKQSQEATSEGELAVRE